MKKYFKYFFEGEHITVWHYLEAEDDWSIREVLVYKDRTERVVDPNYLCDQPISSFIPPAIEITKEEFEKVFNGILNPFDSE